MRITSKEIPNHDVEDFFNNFTTSGNFPVVID